MSMVTRCPACATLFRVTPQQLQSHQGQVRCGQCTTVFDGFRDLATLPEPVSPRSTRSETLAAAGAESAVVPGAAEDVPAPPETDSNDFSSRFPTPELPLAPPVPPGFEFETVESRPARAAAQFVPSARPAPKPETKPDNAGTLQPVSADALFLQQAHAGRRGGSRLWIAGSVLMTFALAGQAAYLYRGDIAANYRGIKPVVVKVCELLQCDVPLPQRPRLINIEASDLQSVDPLRPGVIQLTATLRNRADYDLAYPALDLVLTNTKEHTLARRIFLPREYLEKSRDVNAGFPGNAEITIRLDLDTGELGAAGFRLDLLPAPAR
jgi:predicted Zn finger-like uncharacterized protein